MATLYPISPRPKQRRLSLGLLVFAWGFQAIVTQSLLLREALVLMFGSELAWGIVLFAWLLGVSVGAAVGGRIAASGLTDLRLVAVLCALAVVAGVEVWLFRGARAWLGVGPGEMLSLPKTAVSAILLVSPAGGLVGMAFPLACRISAAAGEVVGTGPLGEVYALESAGSLVGGAAFSFWAVEHLAPIEIVLGCGVFTFAASAVLLASTGRRYSAGGLALGAVGLLVAVVGGGDAFNRRLVERRWRDVAPGYELRAEAESKYQNLAVGERGGLFTLYCDGKVSVSFPDPYTFAPLAHFWMCAHPDPRRVLVLGGGAEGLLAEILRHPVELVDYVEPDPRQIDVVTPFLSDSDRGVLNDPRLTVHHVDGRYFVKTQCDRFDLVIARLPEPMSAMASRFYTDEFYGELRRAMTDRAVLCMTVTAATGELSSASGEYLASVRATLARHFPRIVVGWEDPAQVLAATSADLVTTDPSVLAGRYAARGVRSDYFVPEWFAGATDWLDADKVRRRAIELDAVENASVSTDLQPQVCVQRLILWESAIGGTRGVIARLRAIGLSRVVGALTIIATLTVLVCRLRCGADRGWTRGAIVLSIATTGFTTMALSIVWLFAFQNLYGYVYSRIGWIIAVFMGGLVVGCWWAARRARRFSAPGGGWLWRRLVLVDLMLAVLALSIPLVLPALSAVQGTRSAFVLVELAITLLVAITGVLGGGAFALAGGLQLAATGDPARSAGTINSADHAGACLGALLTGVVLVPMFGTVASAMVLGGMKLASVVLLVLLRRSPDAGR